MRRPVSAGTAASLMRTAARYVCWDVYAYAKEEEKVEGGNVPRAVAHRATFQVLPCTAKM